MLTSCALLLLLALLTACATTLPDEPVAVPAMLQPIFQPCAPGDGAATMQAFQSDQLLGSSEVEWVAKANGDWDVEVTNALGVPVLKLKRTGMKLAISGQLAAKLPKLGIEKSGFLVVDGNKVGIRAMEVPCMLAFRLPRGWMNRIASRDDEGLDVHLSVAEEGRDLDLTARHITDAVKNGTLCARFAWKTMLFFASSLDWCQTVASKQQEATLRGIEDYALKWVPINE